MATTSPSPPNSSPAEDANPPTDLSPGTHSEPPPLLILYSHGRTPPLNPPPDLKFDLRSIPNPPKSARDAHDGRSKRLRAHLLADPRFVRKLEEVKGEIEDVMRGKVDVLSGGEKDVEGKHTIVGEEERDEKDNVESPDQDPNTPVLRVGCNCALGHHRSVAFVEELARLDWPRDWRVQVVHRDVDKKRSAGARDRQKAQWRSNKPWSRRVDGDEDEL